uniref:non-specific serine/threonine protein kinase n=1 Tax=Elaeis guineensis var. tenera TaxID=51953 RepID=A0A8N4EZR6_ELAGV|nr:putative receptor protein kinase ZmPK1 [Elaeis guineensis]
MGSSSAALLDTWAVWQERNLHVCAIQSGLFVPSSLRDERSKRLAQRLQAKVQRELQHRSAIYTSSATPNRFLGLRSQLLHLHFLGGLLEDTCEGMHYVFGSALCYAKSILFNGRSSPSTPGILYLRIPESISTSGSSALQMHQPNCNDTHSEATVSSSNMYASSSGKARWAYFYGFISAFGAIEILFIVSGWWFTFRMEQKPTSLEEGCRLISSQFRQFTYEELKRATGKFMDETGRGGAGVVYKGVLDDKRAVAVKKLGDAIQGELGAELSLIGRIYHKNLVRIWGFCSEGPHKLLITEYVTNGSLEEDRNKRPTMDSVVHKLLSYHDDPSSHKELAVNQ